MTKPGRPDAAELLAAAEQAYATYHEQVRTDPDYPALHLAPPVGRLNDPNGLVYHDGTYHAFYQYSPVHPVRAVFWRYATSTDLTHWQDQKTAIDPIKWYDKNGCYSGSGIVAPNGDLEFFYTGNVKDDDGNRETYQALFTSSNKGETFRRHENNPLITGPAEGYTAHYRDPHVFERNGHWWAVIGAQRENLTGAVVVYTSTDRRTWDFAGELTFSDPTLTDLGYMYECPNLIFQTDEVTGQETAVLIFSPQGMEPDGEKYQNIFQTGYVAGTLDGLHLTVTTPFTELDAGTEFYAPQVYSNTLTPAGEHIMLGWFGNADQDDLPSWDNHWVHQMTYPRALAVRDGKVYQNPVKQLNTALPLTPAQVAADGTLPDLKDARVFRLTGTVDVSAGPVDLVIEDAKGPALTLTFSEDSARLDRSGTRYHVGGDVRTRSLTPASQRTFELLIDAAGTELFVDGGAEVFSSRTFFHGPDRTVRLESPETVQNLNLAVLAE
ncbi:glycoside hydrolase family 32 protein [Rothia nasimurium]|uniref:glycoside hydrolase family 32 protein n=1 Tax=Rothia nasimurium TaxID=85336 RepID=UPI001F400ECD|nr:glycoside hydrolase family 32 protein [Rothia nasimurium]